MVRYGPMVSCLPHHLLFRKLHLSHQMIARFNQPFAAALALLAFSFPLDRAREAGSPALGPAVFRSANSSAASAGQPQRKTAGTVLHRATPLK